MKKAFTTLNNIIEETYNEDSVLTNSDHADKEKSHFRVEETDWFQGVHQNKIVPTNENLLSNKISGKGSRRFCLN